MSRDWYPLIALTLLATPVIAESQKLDVAKALRAFCTELPGSEAKLFEYQLNGFKVSFYDEQEDDGTPYTYATCSLETECSIMDAPSEGHAVDAVIDWLYQALGKLDLTNSNYESGAENRAKAVGKAIGGVTFRVHNIEDDG